MKKLLTLIFLTITLVVTASRYQISFFEYMSDGKLQEADSILREWSRATPNDPDLFRARYDRHIYQAYVKDSAQGSYVDSAFTEFDRGIAACPDRIDFRIDKAAAASMFGRWTTVIDAMDGLLDHDIENGGHWLGVGSELQTNADSLITNAVLGRFVEIYETDLRNVIKAALPTVAKAAKRFDSDMMVLNMAGEYNLRIGYKDTALAYFEKAARLIPDTAMALSYKGYIEYLRGDSVKALEIYRNIADGNYDEESKEAARKMIEQITTPVEDMSEYYYFFRYLPDIANQITNIDKFLDVELINSRIPAANKLRTPFADTDIRIDEFSQHDGEKKVVVWTFPMPEEMPMCRYIAFVPNEEGSYKILTLEKSLNTWVVGSMRDKSHSNYGNISYPEDAAAFVEVLRKKELLE